MIKKIGEILNSIRFWQLVGASVIVYLQTGDWKLAVITLLGGSTVIGTVDKFGQSIGKK